MTDKQLMRWRSATPVHRSWGLEGKIDRDPELAPAGADDPASALTAERFWQMVDPSR